jgi:hypothetical protein
MRDVSALILSALFKYEITWNFNFMGIKKKPITVVLYADSNGTHLHQIYTGLDLLSRKKEIKLVLRLSNGLTKKRPNRQFLALDIIQSNVTKSVIFDMQDSAEIGLPESLRFCDVYFKRSYNKEQFNLFDLSRIPKILPFGLNYQVAVKNRTLTIKRLVLEYISRPFNPLNKRNNFHLHNIKELLDFNFRDRKIFIPDYNSLTPISFEKKYDILFICRLWDPEELNEKNREDAIKINKTRVNILRHLKTNFKERFVGGLQKSKFSEKYAPDLVIQDRKFTSRENYFSLVRQSAIVISTQGLLDSIGWKFAEYVALGKAIISEPIKSELPGIFQANYHYLEFNSTQECCNNVELLINNPEKLKGLEANTTKYFEKHLNPESLMRECIERAINN